MGNKFYQANEIPASEKFIDVKKAIVSKNPKLLKYLPKFLLQYIKKMLHEDELNYANYINKDKKGLDFIDAAVNEFGVKTKTIGEENIPLEGGVILAANHPLGGLDGIAFMKVVGKRRADMRFFVNDLLMAVKNFSPIFVPVNKHGKNSAEYTNNMEEIYASDKCILIFPAGLVSRKQAKGKIEDLVWKKSFIAKAVRYKKNIVPVFIDGENSKRFYNLAYWRKKLGVKANIEMFFLVDEMYKQKGKTLTFTFGEPISWEVFTSDKNNDYWAQRMKEHVYSLGNGDVSKRLPTINVSK